MKLREIFITSLDRGVGRPLLSRLATVWARNLAGNDVAVLYDEYWIHRLGPVHYADSPRFPYHSDLVRGWRREAESRRAISGDFWYHAHVPTPGEVIVDVGAGIGDDTLLFARSVGPSGRVIAIEAHPTTCRALRSVCRRNKLENTECLEVAVSNRKGTLFIEDGENSYTNSVRETSPSGVPSFPVSAETIDAIAQDIGLKYVDLLKINIEGAEVLALEGARGLLENTSAAAVACHDFRADEEGEERFRTKARVLSILQDHGFRVITREDDPRPHVRDIVYGVRNMSPNE